MDCTTLLVKHCFCGCDCDHNANGNGGVSDEMIADLQKELAELKEKVEGMAGCLCDDNTNFTDDELAMQKAALQWARAELGIEHWTGKYHVDGKKIYGKKIDFGELPNSSIKHVPIGTTNIESIVTLAGVTMSGIAGSPIPYPDILQEYSIGLLAHTHSEPTNPNTVRIKTGVDRLSRTAIVTIEYTCTDR